MWNPFRRQTLTELVMAQLVDAQMHLLTAMATRERAEAEEKMYRMRVSRLSSSHRCLTEAEPDPEVAWLAASAFDEASAQERPAPVASLSDRALRRGG